MAEGAEKAEALRPVVLGWLEAQRPGLTDGEAVAAFLLALNAAYELGRDVRKPTPVEATPAEEALSRRAEMLRTFPIDAARYGPSYAHRTRDGRVLVYRDGKPTGRCLATRVDQGVWFRIEPTHPGAKESTIPGEVLAAFDRHVADTPAQSNGGNPPARSNGDQLCS